MNPQLAAFVKESLERGQDRGAIQDVLLQAGWQEGEVRNALSAFADINFPVAVPRPKPSLHAREAFLYLVSFIALYVAAINFGILVFGLIDWTFTDPLDRGDRYPSFGKATVIASVIVAFPLYLFMMRRLSSEIAADPERQQSPVRRWLTYLTLVAGAGIILADVIAVLANLLLGNLAVRLLLKVAAIMVITSCIFGFYLWDIRRAETPASGLKAPPVVWALLIGVAVVVIASIGYSVYLFGAPGEQRSIQFDRQRVSDLTNISHNVDEFWELNGQLPAGFEDMSGTRYSIDSIHDPETGVPYEYRVVDRAEGAYELCAVFATGTAERRERSPRFSDDPWSHGMGKTCFPLEVRRERPMPVEVVPEPRPIGTPPP